MRSRMSSQHQSRGYFMIMEKKVSSSLDCICYMLTEGEALSPDPLDAHFPVRKTASPIVAKAIQVKVPSLQPPEEQDPSYESDFEDYAEGILEWLSLITIGSPRVDLNDTVDPFLARYVPPGDTFTSCRLVTVTWRGFIPSSWANKVFVEILLAAPKSAWFSYSVTGWNDGPLGYNRSSTVLRLPEHAKEFVLWDIA